MAFRLRDNLHWCACGGRIIFLDVDTDRYFGLAPGAEASFERVIKGRPQPADTERLRPLIARGMLIDDPAWAGACPAPMIRPATRDFFEEPSPRASADDLAAAFASEFRVAWLLRRKPLRDVLRTVGQVSASQSSRCSDDAVRGIVSASMAVSLVLRAADRCLVRALAVQWACRRRGIAGKLVFGVRTSPFAAHCWVQLDESVLVGDLEQARLFTPILVLG